MRNFLILFSIVFSLQSIAQEDSLVVRKIYDQVLTNADAHQNLYSLCKSIGSRLSGTPSSYHAISWAENLLNSYGFDKVWLEEIQVPAWKRGNKEILDIDGMGEVAVLALGGSVGTSGVLEAELVEFQSLEEVSNLPDNALKGKIVFFNRPMDPKFIRTFEAYGACVDQRYAGASIAVTKGAVGTLVRSMSLALDQHPHTGSMAYEDSLMRIPAAAIGTLDADILSQLLKSKKITARLQMNCDLKPDTLSYNVIAEITGSKYPNEIILVGGHLDSWDVGEGAHDDGAGVVQSIEVLRTIKKIGYQPQRTIRCVLFMNEENGNRGGKTYAKDSENSGLTHLAAIESDRGGFAPRGFAFEGIDPIPSSLIEKCSNLFESYDLNYFESGYSGVDIRPLKNDKTLLVGLVPDSQRYFDYHHSAADIWENVNKRELELGAAGMTSLVYLIDKYGIPFKIKD